MESGNTPAKPVANSLEVAVATKDGYGRVKKATDVTIRFAGKVVATKTLGGEYSKVQAEREFKRSQQGWEIKDPSGLEIIKQLKLA